MTIFQSLDSKMERDSSKTKEPPLKTVSTKCYWIFISDLSYSWEEIDFRSICVNVLLDYSWEEIDFGSICGNALLDYSSVRD